LVKPEEIRVDEAIDNVLPTPKIEQASSARRSGWRPLVEEIPERSECCPYEALGGQGFGAGRLQLQKAREHA